MNAETNTFAWGVPLAITLFGAVALTVFYLLWALWDFARSLHRRRRIVRWLFVAAISFLVLGTLAASAWTFNTHRQINAELAAIVAAGEPLKLNETHHWSDKTAPDNAGAQYELAIEILVSELSLEDPNVFQVNPNNPLSFDHVKDAYANWLTGKSQAAPTQEQRERAKLLLAANPAMFARVDLAAQREGCVFTWGFENGMPSVTTKLSKALSMAQWLSLRALVRAADGDGDEAIASLRSSLRMLRIFDNEGVLITYLAKGAVQSLIANDALAILSSGSASEEGLRSLASEIMMRDPTADYPQALMVERAYGLALLGAVSQDFGVMSLGHLPDSLRYQSIRWPTRDAMTLGYLRISRRQIAASREPWPGVIDAMRSLQPKGMEEWLAQSMTGPLAGRILVLVGRTATDLRIAHLATLIELYRRKHGAPPERLEAMVPEFAVALPPDPFSGEPLKFRVEESSIVLYSVHDDRRDDGGKIQPLDTDPPDWGHRVRLP